jgi:hypothetical protein
MMGLMEMDERMKQIADQIEKDRVVKEEKSDLMDTVNSGAQSKGKVPSLPIN